MGIFSRFADIVNSNITSLLDKAEDPKKMVRLIIQEMEDTLVEVRSNSASLIAQKKELQRRITRAMNQETEWQSKAELALSKEREDLARGALIEKQKSAELVKTLSDDMVLIEEQLALLKNEVEQLQSKLDEARARQKAMVMRTETASSRLQVKKQLDTSRIQDSMDKFDQYERRVEDLESQVEAQDLGARSLNDEFAELEAQDAISDELEALKKKMSKSK
ncbi:phage shock protein PspA [Psychrobium sp. 1_MG-2023]|uniref:phage shock protein PspA n=1 Tax=Psychrobium sp. 1_MG-2023 TaxID=3062624 RepID=UPI000C32612F|nr:phage shock protein PspA [Psychrobium sp. 1_MG-2023]MDP2562426.1 phage shock protein PspA [Psychrobium sp. 1_MG-2023]PKF56154.1 phage shock protein PspA [Alteromonadales bacterium alter-6D02]